MGRVDYNRNTIGRNIRRRRLVGGLSHEIFATRAGITTEQSQAFEKGHQIPTDDELKAMAPVLRCTVDDLCRSDYDYS